jgi:uncharacterized membrane protein YjjP (DUF1212 family)
MSDAVEPVGDQREASVVDFLAQLGAAMLNADYPVNIVRRVLTHACDRYNRQLRFLVFPNVIQVGEHTDTRIERADADLRFDQTFPLGTLVQRANCGEVTPADGLAELSRIDTLAPRFPGWVGVIGYTTQSAAYALILQPTPIALIVATGFGFLVGLLDLLARLNNGFRQILPALSAFLVTFIAFSLGRWLNLGQDSLRILIPPLTLFLPGVSITLAVIESASREMVSGAARLTAGFMQLGQLALGIVIAIQLLGLTNSELTDVSRNKIGPWAPWLGVAVYAVGIVLYFGPPRRFGRWLVLVLFATYGSQLATAAVFGGYISGFGGGLALMLLALVLSGRRDTPSTQVLLTPGFWLMVPSSVGLIGVTELTGGMHSGAVTVMLASMVSIALGFQAGLAIWSVFPHRDDMVNDLGY